MNPAAVVEQSMNRSDVILNIDRIKQKLAGRKLSKTEIEKLISNDNRCDYWGQIRVAEKFIPANIYNCHFSGSVYLGVFSKEITLDEVLTWKAGLYNSTIFNCVIGDETVVKDVDLLANYYIETDSLLLHCREISFHENSSYAIGDELAIANETGGREVPIFPELTIDFAANLATHRDPAMLKNVRQKISEYQQKAKSPTGYIGKQVIIKNTVSVQDSYIGNGAIFNNATAIHNSLLLSEPGEATSVMNGAWIHNSILQWGVEVDTMAIVDHSLLCEHSHAERHAKVTESIIGPNTGIAEGEVTSCLCGPFIGFHHQALLIAAFWPEGKGNVAYGANVGSNHTAKAPDQEIFPGEGMFFGLGVNIKFPANFQESPYSIIATGVCTLPQKVAFPFSLINAPAAIHKGISPAYNELMPGWVLANNIYMLRRNEGKYQKRDKAKRNKMEYRVFRKEIVDMMVDARKRLQAAEIKSIYTENTIPGLGKNYMSERGRLTGIEAYTFFIKYYALNLLREKCKQLVENEEVTGIIPTDDEDEDYCHARAILSTELPDLSLKDCLELFVDMQRKIAGDVEQSKRKDDTRGRKIIDDYDDIYTSAEKNDFVIQTWRETELIEKEIIFLLGKL